MAALEVSLPRNDKHHYISFPSCLVFPSLLWRGGKKQVQELLLVSPVSSLHDNMSSALQIQFHVLQSNIRFIRHEKLVLDTKLISDSSKLIKRIYSPASNRDTGTRWGIENIGAAVFPKSKPNQILLS
ncbi:hypothetical protein Dimus_020200 [Dionaea muscipula]